jgi:NAD(P)-dependent dehydrogenase (short-subunit alcohol dehydrogenase family)
MQDYGCLDILVNNAGIDGEQALIADSSIENWRRVLSINQDGVYFGMKYGIAAILKEGQGGVVLNMASIGGMIALENFSAYTAAKAAVIQLTRTAAIEYATHRIRVNALCPTIVRTPLLEHAIQNSPDPEKMRQEGDKFNPIPGMPTPEDIAAAALFLASDEAAFITGVALPIDGGYTAR